MVRAEKTQKEKLRIQRDKRFYRAYEQRKNLSNATYDLENLIYEAAKQTIREKNKLFSELVQEDSAEPALVRFYARDAIHEFEGIWALYDKLIPYGTYHSDIYRKCRDLISHYDEIYHNALRDETPLSLVSTLFNKE